MMKISPYDILFFRESRDFSAGENHVAGSIEPLPHTIAGAIMGAIYEKGELDLLNLRRTNSGVEKIPDPGNWKPKFSILGTFFGFRKANDKGEARPLFALPMDLVEVEGRIAPLRAHPLPDGRVGVVAEVKGKKVLHFGPRRAFIPAEVLKRYLSGDLNDGPHVEANIREVKDVYERETRIGIGLNEKRTAQEGLLYRISALRLQEEREKEVLEETVITVYFEPGDEKVIEDTIGEKGLLKLGGESRFAGFEFKAGSFPLKTGGDVKAGEKFKLYVATPLIVNGSSVRAFIEEELKGKAHVVKVFTDRLIHVTGWDAVKKMPKPTYYALPPGTVIWLDAEKDLSIPPKLGRMTWAGYGLVLVGGGW